MVRGVREAGAGSVHERMRIWGQIFGHSGALCDSGPLRGGLIDDWRRAFLGFCGAV